MSIIQITVQGTELENVTVNLDTAQVTALYLDKQKNLAEIADLMKKKNELEKAQKYNTEQKDKLDFELKQAHALLSALGVDEKTKEEEAYYRTPLSLTTRLALYFATHK
jgi:Na+-transporting NADH:ubiquinone oxidoreductase subunit NqrC